MQLNHIDGYFHLHQGLLFESGLSQFIKVTMIGIWIHCTDGCQWFYPPLCFSWTYLRFQNCNVPLLTWLLLFQIPATLEDSSGYPCSWLAKNSAVSLTLSDLIFYHSSRQNSEKVSELVWYFDRMIQIRRPNKNGPPYCSVREGRTQLLCSFFLWWQSGHISPKNMNMFSTCKVQRRIVSGIPLDRKDLLRIYKDLLSHWPCVWTHLPRGQTAESLTH